MKLFLRIVLCCCAGVMALASASIIDPSLQKRFIGGGGGETQNVMISFTQSINTVINQINSQNFSDINTKRTALTNAQQTFTAQSQAGLKTFLNSLGVPFESYWISNQMIVPSASSGLVSTLSTIPGVAKIEKEPQAEIIGPMAGGNVELTGNLTRNSRQAFVAWGVQKIRANAVWKQFTGKGVTIAGIDSGVRYTHDALRSNWRSSYGWYDPYEGTPTPNDQNGHGTHTMGTIAGNGVNIGVAPGATWIACKGCSDRSCSGSALLSCGQWVQCPTLPDGSNKDCSKAPKVVSNSWGISVGGQTFYDQVINSWQSAGIIPIFAIGNDGSGCGTARSPGDRPNLISVGSTNEDEKISDFSSRGPTVDSSKRLKPEISAPGGNVPSAWNTGDNQYAYSSGTSMACPHVTGVVALMLQKNSKLTYNQIYNAMLGNTVTKDLDTSTSAACGGRSPGVFPNNAFGYGRIDAVNCLNAINAA